MPLTVHPSPLTVHPSPLTVITLPTLEFRSTSTGTLQSGSDYQSAAVTGYVSSEDYYSATGYRSSARRAVMDDDPFGGETIGDVDNPIEPGEAPLGDGLGILLLCAMLFIAIRKMIFFSSVKGQ